MQTVTIQITGPQGSGKTQIAEAIARELERLGFTGVQGEAEASAPSNRLVPRPTPPAFPACEIGVRNLTVRTCVEIVS